MSKYKMGATPLLLTSYIKFERLNEINATIFGNTSPECVDIYIDLYSVLYPLLRGAYDPALDEDSKCSIAAGILNMIAHYRRFYWGYKIKTRFFLVYSENMSTHSTMVYPAYNKDNIAMKSMLTNITSVINHNLGLVDQLVKYITDSVFVCSQFNTDAMMYYIHQYENSGNPSLLITKDIVTMQLAGVAPMMVVLRPKKHHGEDTSVFVSPVNNGLLKYMCDKRNTKYPLTDEQQISPALFSFILAGTRVPERGLKSILSIPDMIRETYTAVCSNYIANGYNTDPNIVCEEMSEKANVSLQRGRISGRFKAIDTIYQEGILLNSPETKLYSGMANLYDPKGLHDLDTLYFSKCHLNLEYL